VSELVSHEDVVADFCYSWSMTDTPASAPALGAYAKGPAAYTAFTASLTPTHDYQVLCESERTISTDLIREHHPGIIGHHLRSMDGADPWAMVLSAARPPERPRTSLHPCTCRPPAPPRPW
jgi:hypothetical protein